MKRLLVVVILGLLAIGLSFAQDWDNPEFVERLDLDEQEVEQIREIFEQTEREMREARLELDVLRAQLRRLLFQEQVNMRELVVGTKSRSSFNSTLGTVALGSRRKIFLASHLP